MAGQNNQKKQKSRKTNGQKQRQWQPQGQQQVKRILLRDESLDKAKGFNLMSNVFMSVALKDIPACQHFLRTATGIKDLVVKEVRIQYYIAKITSHDAILDILAEDGKGQLYIIEIQRSDTIDHARRTRFYGAMVDSEFLQKGKSYDEMPEVHVIYISEKDIWKQGRAIYRVEKTFDGTDIPYDDGRHVTYINAEVDDGSDIAKLMKYFKTADPMDMSQGDLSKRVHFLKCRKGGNDVMCAITDEILENGKKLGRSEGLREGRRKGRREGRIEGKIQGKIEGKVEQAKVTSLNLAKMGMPFEKIAEAVNNDIEVVRKWIEEGNMLVG